MKQNKLADESKYLGALFIAALVIFKILFYKENIVTLFRTVFALFWLFVLPGFSLMYYWHEKLGFLERLVIGIAVSASVTGIASYYAGLLGLNIRYHPVLLPILLLLTGFFIIWKKKEQIQLHL